MNSIITLKTKVQRNPNMVSSKIDNEIVMMSIENGEYYGLDEVGSRIWELIATPVAVEELILALLDEFEVEKQDCEKETFEFLEELNSKNLLTVINY